MLNSFNKHLFLFILCVGYASFLPLYSQAQEQEQEQNLDMNAIQRFMKEPLEIHGNFSANAQYYFNDSAIGAPDVPEKLLMNGFGNVIIDKGPFSAGFRYESYLNPVLGFDARYQGSGIPYRYFTFKKHGLEVTAGNFYEQFGVGLLLRSYEERDLGLDNAFDGLRVKYHLGKGVYLKGLIGRQRYFFDLSQGIVRAADAEVVVNEMFESMKTSKLKLKLGASFVSKYQEDNNPSLVLPENVGSYGGRLLVNYKDFSFMAEYAYKENDPSFDNLYIYKPGQGLYLSGSYSRKGFGVNLTAKTVDNMSFRSDRDETLFNLMINYMPALTKQHTYNLAATLYPYATQPTGETAIQGDMFFKLKKKTWYGGKYGTRVEFNAAKAWGLDSTQLHDETTERLGYTSPFFSTGEEYYQDINITVSRKIVKWFKVKAMYMNLMVNNSVMNFAGLNGKFDGKIYSDIAVLETLFKINNKNSIRTELQALWSNQDQGDWATLVIEYTFSPHWTIAVLDQYNYGNPIAGNRIHYPYAYFGYVNKSNRISLGYGRQKAGLFCVGGICRQVPASNGFTLTITSSF